MSRLTETGYKALAAAAIRLAVEDLESAYKKVKHWHELEQAGKLKAYVAKEKNRLKKVTITAEETTAIAFFERRDGQYHLLFGVLDIDGLPQKVSKELCFIKEQSPRLLKIIAYYKGQATKAEKERTLNALN